MDSLEGARKAKADADASLKVSNDLVAAVEAKLQQLQDKFMEARRRISSSVECFFSFSLGRDLCLALLYPRAALRDDNITSANMLETEAIHGRA